jgi:hypothetical protein
MDETDVASPNENTDGDNDSGSVERYIAVPPKYGERILSTSRYALTLAALFAFATIVVLEFMSTRNRRPDYSTRLQFSGESTTLVLLIDRRSCRPLGKAPAVNYPICLRPHNS